jgi:hypothetical protein
LPIAKAINEQEKAAGPDVVMAYWGIAQNFDASVIVNPLRRLHDLAANWLASLEKTMPKLRNAAYGQFWRTVER